MGPVLTGPVPMGPATAPESLLLLMADGRFPGGGHAHSGGLEAAVADGSVHDEASLRSFLLGRLLTSGPSEAWFAAEATRHFCSSLSTCFHVPLLYFQSRRTARTSIVWLTTALPSRSVTIASISSGLPCSTKVLALRIPT